MGGGPSKLSEEQLKEVQRLIQRWTQNQDNETNTALRGQYTRLTDLMNQLGQRLTDRQTQSADRLETQMNELRQQLETMQKKVDSKEGAESSGNRVNDFLSDLAGILGEKDAANFPQKMQFANHPSSMGGPTGFGPFVMQQNYGGPQYGPRGYPGPYHQNPNMPHHPGVHPNFGPNLPHPPCQQSPPRPPMDPPFTHNLPHPPCQQSPPRPPMDPPFTHNFTAPPGAPSQHQQKQINKSESTKPAGKTKFQKEKSKNRQPNLTMPSVVYVSSTKARKSTDPKITNITQRFEETRKEMHSQKKKPVKLEDIEEAIAQFKLQQIENDKENTGSAKHSQKSASTEKHDQNDNLAEKRNLSFSKRFDKTEPGNRRDQYKSKGRGKGSHEEWKSKNREARKKMNPRKTNNDESDSDSNESVVSNFSTVSRARTAPTARNRRVFWTTRPNYARDYHFARVQSRIESVTEGLNLGYYKSNPVDDEVPADQNLLNEKLEGNKHSQKKRDPKPSTSRDSNLKVWNYPSEKEARAKGADVRKPLEKPVLFIGLTESDEHCTHSPKCLADIYELERRYESFQLVSLTS